MQDSIAAGTRPPSPTMWCFAAVAALLPLLIASADEPDTKVVVVAADGQSTFKIPLDFVNFIQATTAMKVEGSGEQMSNKIDKNYLVLLFTNSWPFENVKNNSFPLTLPGKIVENSLQEGATVFVATPRVDIWGALAHQRHHFFVLPAHPMLPMEEPNTVAIDMEVLQPLGILLSTIGLRSPKTLTPPPPPPATMVRPAPKRNLQGREPRRRPMEDEEGMPSQVEEDGLTESVSLGADESPPMQRYREAGPVLLEVPAPTGIMKNTEETAARANKSIKIAAICVLVMIVVLCVAFYFKDPLRMYLSRCFGKSSRAPDPIAAEEVRLVTEDMGEEPKVI